MEERSLRDARAGEEPGVHAGGGVDAGARDWVERGNFLGGLFGAAAAAAVLPAGSPGDAGRRPYADARQRTGEPQHFHAGFRGLAENDEEFHIVDRLRLRQFHAGRERRAQGRLRDASAAEFFCDAGSEAGAWSRICGWRRRGRRTARGDVDVRILAQRFRRRSGSDWPHYHAGQQAGDDRGRAAARFSICAVE